MNPITYIKLGIVAFAVVAIFVLAGMGRVTPTEAIAGCTTVVGALVVALGIQGAGSAIASGNVAAAKAVPLVATLESTDTEPKPPKLPPIVGAMMGLVCMLTLLASLLFLTGCPQAVGPVVAGGTLLECIATDVAEQKPLGQIIADCGGDAVAVVTSILGSSDPQVLASKAHAEAMNLRAALYVDAGVSIGPGK